MIGIDGGVGEGKTTLGVLCGLSVDWFGKAFVNPPYSQVRKWLEKAIFEVDAGRCELAVFLVFARTDTRWFHDLIYHKFDILFLKGRLKFGDSKQGAPAPSMLIWIKKGCSS